MKTEIFRYMTQLTGFQVACCSRVLPGFPLKSKFFLFFALMLFSIAGYSQGCIRKTIEVNGSREFKTTLPFDQYFRIKLTGDKIKDVYSAFVYYYDQGTNKLDDSPQAITEDLGNLTRFEKEIHLQVAPLEPKREVYIAIVYKPHGNFLKKLMKVNALIYDEKRDQAKKALDNIRNSVISPLDNGTTFFSERFQCLSADDSCYERFFFEILLPKYDTLQSESYQSQFSERYLMYMDSVMSSHKLATGELNQVRTAGALELITGVEQGTISLSDIYKRAAGKTEMDKRIENLDTSIKFSKNVLKAIDQLVLKVPENEIVADQRSLFAKFLLQLQGNHKMLSSANKAILQAMRARKQLYHQEFVYGNSNFTTLKIESSYRVIPDFGITYIPIFGDSDRKGFFRTYAGASIYFRPVDKEVPLQCFDRSFLHRFSLNLGVTLGPINENGYEDLYRGVSLLVGGNYKFQRAFTISTGLAFFKQPSENPVNQKKPLAITPYFGVAVDVDLISGFGKVASKLF